VEAGTALNFVIERNIKSFAKVTDVQDFAAKNKTTP
jgi:hypothetical protein